MKHIEQIVDHLLTPSEALINDIARLEGDILILGAGGKMGPAMAKLAKQAIDKSGTGKKVIAASRFSEAGLAEDLQACGIETIAADLLKEDQLKALPDVPNVLYLAGTKFGTAGNAPFTWAMNTYLPGKVAEKYRDARIVVFSTGNVYPLSPVTRGGLDETEATGPIGEYAQSCLGRERIFQYHSSLFQTPLLMFRLNYANDVSYGVLLEIAKAVKEGRAIDLAMGHVNVIWQGDANEMAIRALHHCSFPAKILNVTGPETIPVRWIAEEFGKRFGQSPAFTGEEQPTALLSNAAEAFHLFGYPKVTLKVMIDIIARWLSEGGKIINKPTHFQQRKGQF